MNPLFRQLSLIALITSLATLTSACATTRPCSKAGDTTWDPPLRGNMECRQKMVEEKRLNHGIFRQFHPNGKVALTGEFREGKKHGTWIQYNEKDEPVKRRRYENGVEVGQ